MKKLFTALLALMAIFPLYGQKMSKEEKKAAEMAAYEAALGAINAKAFVIVPTSYQTTDGEMYDNVDNSVYLSAEGENFYVQGTIICGNKYTNLLAPTEYTVNVDKKGNVKVRLVAQGRQLQGTYNITMRNGNNVADVIFNQPGKTTRRFTGPVVPLAEANYLKGSNIM